MFSTVFVSSLCVVVYLLTVARFVSLVCISPRDSLASLGVFVSSGALSPFFHLSAMHIFMNMFSFFGQGVELERQHIGSAQLLHLIFVVLVPLTAVLYVGLGQLLSVVFASVRQLAVLPYMCSAGFSGVIFALIIVTASCRGERYVLLFGHRVHAHLYPWVLLALIQILVPQASWLGHAAGILSGYLFAAVRRHLELPAWLVAKVDDAVAPWLPRWESKVEVEEEEVVVVLGEEVHPDPARAAAERGVMILEAMGFERSRAEWALAQENGDVQRAAERLASNN